MFLIDKISLSIGKRAKEALNLDENKEKIVVYGAINLLQMLWAILWVVIVGYIFGVLYEALIFSTMVSILRKYSGGVHSSSPNGCVAIGTLVATVAGLIAKGFFYKLTIPIISVLSFSCIVIAFIIVIKKAPVDSPKKPIKNIEMRKTLRVYSIVTLFIYAIIIILLIGLYINNSRPIYFKGVACISLGVLWQSFTLTKIGAKILNKVDSIFKI